MPEKNGAWKFHVAQSESKDQEAARRERQFRAVIEMLVSRWQAEAREADRHDDDHAAG
ncbi:MAG: hypothetical protein JNM43_04805 [Planctomycetaceae bacterium]|nr:hypothetical protein [Planctomycetaceae bacterium]